MNDYPHSFPPPWAEAWGDDRYGLWAELLVNGVTQRMRWLAPGSFMMGSPDAEPGHQKNEGPQHRVTLTDDFWLADTACTQALWLAVMGGDNPSYVQDDQEKPVDQVSWKDVQGFFTALQVEGMLPVGIAAVLPTEAQWEYACRASTDTPYSFGKTISTEQVNCDFDGKWRKRVRSKQTTVPVKALPANAWGLYQMHGNIWEWCADGMRVYTQGSEINPTVEITNAEISVRGGAWRGEARFERSAQRSHRALDKRLNLLGFRFALRFTAQSAASGPRLEGA